MKITITIYRFTGKHGPFNIPKFICEECDLTVSVVNKIVKELGNNLVKVEVKSWFKNFFEVIIKGGWHAPVTTVNGKVFTKGKVPNHAALKKTIRKMLN